LNQGQKVEEVGDWDHSVWQLCLRWKRARFEWESKLEEELMTYLAMTKLCKEEKDVQVWGNDEIRCFSVSSTYKCLAKQGSGPQYDVFKYLWKAKGFPSVVSTTWRVLTDSLPIRERLGRRAVTMNTSLCALCQTKEESCQHLFLQCKHAMSV